MDKGKGEWKGKGEGKEERGIKVEKEKKEKEKKEEEEENDEEIEGSWEHLSVQIHFRNLRWRQSYHNRLQMELSSTAKQHMQGWRTKGVLLGKVETKIMPAFKLQV